MDICGHFMGIYGRLCILMHCRFVHLYGHLSGHLSGHPSGHLSPRINARGINARGINYMNNQLHELVIILI